MPSDADPEPNERDDDPASQDEPNDIGGLRAPSAMRMPISFVRCETAYDMTP